MPREAMRSGLRQLGGRVYVLCASLYGILGYPILFLKPKVHIFSLFSSRNSIRNLYKSTCLCMFSSNCNDVIFIGAPQWRYGATGGTPYLNLFAVPQAWYMNHPGPVKGCTGDHVWRIWVLLITQSLYAACMKWETEAVRLVRVAREEQWGCSNACKDGELQHSVYWGKDGFPDTGYSRKPS